MMIWDKTKKILRPIKRRLYKDSSLHPGKNFIRQNKKIWRDSRLKNPSNEVLFEFTRMQPNIVTYSYFANFLAEYHNAKIVVYCLWEDITITDQIEKTYSSFNAQIIKPSLTKEQESELDHLVGFYLNKIKSKKDFYELTIDGILVGDLFYDHYLRRYDHPTVFVDHEDFPKALRDGIKFYLFWKYYIHDHSVKAINITHCCYLNGIPLRIAVNQEIPVHQANIHGIYTMSQKDLWAYRQTDYYPSLEKLLTKEERQNGISKAKENIEERFKGAVGVNMIYSTKSAFGSVSKQRVLADTNKTKILITPHDFMDSPNGIGKGLFMDFYEWMVFLGELSKKTDYEWYVKTHPDGTEKSKAVVVELCNLYSKFTHIPSDTSHHQIIQEGINVTLTVSGTVGWEYAYFDKLVINAHPDNPHSRYSFNLNPKTVEEYEELLMNLPEIEHSIDKDEIFEYYMMRSFYSKNDNWLIDNFQKTIRDMGGYRQQFNDEFYSRFLESSSRKGKEEIFKLLNIFIESNDSCLNWLHMKTAVSS
tara:strand:- start:1067 stop:2662 length:1596 start_codon:yes stop_codon:yes gene_type:complete